MRFIVPVRRTISRMRPYCPPLEGRAGKLRLDFNENTLGCAPMVRRVLAQLTREKIATYPEYQALRLQLAHFFRVRANELILTSGTDDSLHLIADTVIEPGSTVLLIEPTFAMYRFYAERAGAKIVALRYDDQMRLPLESVVQALRSHPRVFFLANPNNPTGTLAKRDELRQLLKAAAATLVVVDEAYFEFAGFTVLPWIRRNRNLIVLRTFSKAAGLAGLRIGCLLAHRALVAALRKAQSPYSVNTAALVAAEATIRIPSYVRRYAREVNRSREMLRKALHRLGIPCFPSAANFVLADFGRRGPTILRRLRRQGILLRDRQADFGRVGLVRITVGTHKQTQRLLSALEQLWPSSNLRS